MTVTPKKEKKMNFQHRNQTESCHKEQLTTIYAIAEVDTGGGGDGGGRGHPRCLATLPNNIEELIHQFKMQEKGLSIISQIQIKQNMIS